MPAVILARPSLAATIPALIDHGVMSSVDEVRSFSMAVLFDIIKQAGVYIRLDSCAVS